MVVMKRTAQEWKELMGANIRAARMVRGWTQKGLAGELRSLGFTRCTRSLLAKIETGEVALRFFEIYYFREVFGKSFEKEFWRPCNGQKRKTLPPGKRF